MNIQQRFAKHCTEHGLDVTQDYRAVWRNVTQGTMVTQFQAVLRDDGIFTEVWDSTREGGCVVSVTNQPEPPINAFKDSPSVRRGFSIY